MTTARLAQKKHGRDIDGLFKAMADANVRTARSELFTRFEFLDGSALIVANGPFTVKDFTDLYDAVEDGVPI